MTSSSIMEKRYVFPVRSLSLRASICEEISMRMTAPVAPTRSASRRERTTFPEPISRQPWPSAGCSICTNCVATSRLELCSHSGLFDAIAS